MAVEHLGRGILLGLAIAAPVGPIGILCIRRTLMTQGWQVGFMTGLGAATADGLYGSIAGLGLVAITQILTAHTLWLQLLGGLFLAYLAMRTWRESPSHSPAQTDHPSRLLLAYGSTLALTLTNPATIFAFIAIFAGSGMATASTPSEAGGLTVLGVCLGSALWWLLLCSLTHRLRQRITLQQLGWINRLSAGILLAFAIAAIASAKP